jgi:hypothetical protein
MGMCAAKQPLTSVDAPPKHHANGRAHVRRHASGSAMSGLSAPEFVNRAANVVKRAGWDRAKCLIYMVL